MAVTITLLAAIMIISTNYSGTYVDSELARQAIERAEGKVRPSQTYHRCCHHRTSNYVIVTVGKLNVEQGTRCLGELFVVQSRL